jgi:hypothetical protein
MVYLMGVAIELGGNRIIVSPYNLIEIVGLQEKYIVRDPIHEGN